MTYRVVTTSESDADITSISLIIHSRSPRGAVAWLEAYDSAIDKLAVNADGCPLADEYEGFDIVVREALFSTRRGKSYRLIFTIVEDEVRIRRVHGPGQSAVDPSDI